MKTTEAWGHIAALFMVTQVAEKLEDATTQHSVRQRLPRIGFCLGLHSGPERTTGAQASVNISREIGLSAHDR